MENTRAAIGDLQTLEALLAHTLTDLYEDGVTTVRPYAFYNNTGLESVTLPNAVKIGAYAFSGCANLAALTLPGSTVCALGAGALTGTSIASGAGYIYVPETLVDVYKEAAGWSSYAARITAISKE